ncbi:MAG: hypothetical protein AAF653_09830, partial [Chloroflexota bacterium]
MSLSPALADTPQPALFLVQEHNGIRFVRVDSNGEQQDIPEPLEQFAIWRYGEAEWLIVLPAHVQVSPDGESIVWTAFISSNFSDAGMFILSLV